MNAMVWLDSVVQDVRHAVRTLARAPLFAATVVMTIGLGLGLVGSAFTIFNAYLFKTIDLPNPRALYVLIWETAGGLRRQKLAFSRGCQHLDPSCILDPRQRQAPPGGREPCAYRPVCRGNRP